MNNYIYEFLNEKCHDIYIYIYTYCNKRNDLKSKIQSTV